MLFPPPPLLFSFFFFCTYTASKWLAWEGRPAFEGGLVLLRGFIDLCKTSHLLVEENAQKRGEVADRRRPIAPFQAATVSYSETTSRSQLGERR